MYKCIFYDDENKKKKITLNIDSKEEVFKYANENNIEDNFRLKKYKPYLAEEN